MNAEEVGSVLAKAAAYDQRTVGAGDILAWLEVIGDLDLGDALAAVARHYRDSTARIMPADVHRLVKAIREDRRRIESATEPRALPGRFEPDITRDIRIRRGLALCADVLTPIRARLEAAEHPTTEETNTR